MITEFKKKNKKKHTVKHYMGIKGSAVAVKLSLIHGTGATPRLLELLLLCDFCSCLSANLPLHSLALERAAGVRLMEVSTESSPALHSVQKWSLQRSCKKLTPAAFRPNISLGCKVVAMEKLQQDAEGRSVVQGQGTLSSRPAAGGPAYVVHLQILLCDLAM